MDLGYDLLRLVTLRLVTPRPVTPPFVAPHLVAHLLLVPNNSIPLTQTASGSVNRFR